MMVSPMLVCVGAILKYFLGDGYDYGQSSAKRLAVMPDQAYKSMLSGDAR
jgi:hypothetical protein